MESTMLFMEDANALLDITETWESQKPSVNTYISNLLAFSSTTLEWDWQDFFQLYGEPSATDLSILWANKKSGIWFCKPGLSGGPIYDMLL